MSQQVERYTTDLARADEMSIDSVVAQVHKVQQLMNMVMKNGEHYGVIPGTDKPTLLKPGAEKLCMTFRLNPQYDVLDSSQSAELVQFVVLCHLIHIITGQEWGSGMGACNSREKKYRFMYTPMEPKPSQSEADELKAAGKGGWRKVSNKWVFHLKTENDNAYDYSNTILKMASKRALVAAVLNATAASDIFTQDMEDLQEKPANASSPTPAPSAMIEVLRTTAKELAEYAPELWSDKALTLNIQKRFSTESIDDMTQEQAQSVMDGMEAWAEMNPPPDPDDNDEPITGNVVEEPPPEDPKET